MQKLKIDRILKFNVLRFKINLGQTLERRGARLKG